MVLFVRSKLSFFLSCMVGTISVKLTSCGTYHMNSSNNAPMCANTTGASNLTNYQGVDYG